MSIELTQEKADALLAVQKVRVDNNQHLFSDISNGLRIPLNSQDKREEFFLTIYRGKIELAKNTFQTLARKTTVLVRLDLGGPPHRNPDGHEIPCPHLHLYREGYSDKWAFPIPSVFGNISDVWQSLQDFMDYCNIVEKPAIIRGLLT